MIRASSRSMSSKRGRFDGGGAATAATGSATTGRPATTARRDRSDMGRALIPIDVLAGADYDAGDATVATRKRLLLIGNVPGPSDNCRARRCVATETGRAWHRPSLSGDARNALSHCPYVISGTATVAPAAVKPSARMRKFRRGMMRAHVSRSPSMVFFSGQLFRDDQLSFELVGPPLIWGRYAVR